tara:strand:+ start:2690 stop:3391 length:702 start_codon:yes stop_codon:yes gene_type:complete
MYCIVLRGSQRIQNVKDELKLYGFGDALIVERDRDVEDGKRGCFESHKAVLAAGLKTDAKAIVVFEDDVRFWDRGALPPKGLIEEAVGLATTTPSLIVGLGGYAAGPIGALLPGTRSFRRSVFACTHCYVCGRDIANEIIKWDYGGEHIDHVLMRRHGSNMALAVPSVAFQASYFWDLTNTENTITYKIITYFRNLLGPAIIQVIFEVFWRAVAYLLAWCHVAPCKREESPNL